MSKIKLNINSQIKDKLASKNISLHDGLCFLLCIYYGVKPSYIPEELARRILAVGIVTKDYSNDTIEWKIPLFEETINGFEWITEWMDLFKVVNKDRRGVKNYVLKRMKTFFINNPSVRVEQVMEATKMYLRSVDNPIYCKKSHKFIYEADGSSMLEEYVALHGERITKVHKYNDDVI